MFIQSKHFAVFSSLLLLDAALAGQDPDTEANTKSQIYLPGENPTSAPTTEFEGNVLLRRRRELKASETSALFEGECNAAPYDVAVYINKHIYLAGIPSKDSACPLLVMEASDPAWTEEAVQEAIESTTESGLKKFGGLQKHIHEVSLPAGIDPRSYFDLLPLGTFPLSELLQAYEEATATPPENAMGSDSYKPSLADGSLAPENYDLVLAHCGELAIQIGSNLGVKASSRMADYTASRLLETYEDIGNEIRSNPNVVQLVVDEDEEVNDISDKDLIRRILERRVRFLEEDNGEKQASSSGIPCGKWYSKDCIGDSDIRYASDASDSLADQATLWSVLPGYYEADSYGLGPNGEKIPPTFMDEGDELLTPSAFPFSYDAVKLFFNITVDGSRYYEHSYKIFPPAPEDFCNDTVPAGMTNSAAPGECGVNGFSIGSDRYGTSSHERDGSLVVLPFAETWYSPGRVLEPYVSTPVNDRTGFASISMEGILYQYTMACFDAACSGLSVVIEAFDVSDPARASLIQTTRMTARRIDTADDFVDRINQVYDDFNVLEEQQYPAPMTSEGNCLSGVCPTEDVWCEFDPNCSASPYQEPAGSIRPGIYVLIVLVVLALNSIAFMFAARRFMKKRENALKEKFAVRIAETIKVEGEDRVLTAENIAEEFKQIDVDGSGMVSKAELFEFIQTGKVGKVSESDFDSLFAAIDLDKNGEIDFGEFVTFFKKCQHKYDEVKDQPAIRQNRQSYAINAMK